MARAVTKRAKKEKEQKVKLPFDVGILNSFIKYMRCEYVGGSQVRMLHRLISNLELTDYVYQLDIYLRLRTLKELLELHLEGIQDESLLYSSTVQRFADAKEILDDIGLTKNQLNSAECEHISKVIEERVQTLEVFSVRERMIQLLSQLQESYFDISYYGLMEELKTLMGKVMMSLQETNSDQGLLREFSFSDENAVQLLGAVLKKAKLPASILQTGIRQLNAILSPGFQSGRLYTILGGSGKFKSGTLLNLADQIRRYNPQITPFENGMQKTILFITLENSIEESIERIYDMYSAIDDDFRDREIADVVNTFKTNGEFSFTAKTGLDITFIYRGNLEISTADIYGIVRELNEKGKQPICIFLDYIKRIESAHPSMGDERVRMSYVAKELKTIAQFYQIPVITAMQLNRDGNAIIDAAMRDSKQDVARFVGSSSIGNAWDIIEDSDWVCLINLELQKSTNQLFLTFKRLKIRSKKSKDNTIDYFNHPFTNEKCIRLMPDVDKENGVSIISLASDLESIAEAENDLKSSRERPKASRISTEVKSQKILNTIKAIQLDGLVA